MTEGTKEFCRQLAEMEYEYETVEPNRVIIDFNVDSGRFAGQQIRLGFEVPSEFPRTPPHGPHFSPGLLPINPSLKTHPDRVHPSKFGNDWRHWSRPVPHWRGKQGVAGYLAFVADLFLKT